MPLTPYDLDIFRILLSGSEVIEPHEQTFTTHTVPWSLAYDASPGVALVPSTTAKLGAVVKYLYDSDLGFVVRGRGCGSSSAHDVVLSMQAFDGFEVRRRPDGTPESVDVGAGLDWGEVDERLEKLAPGYVVVGSRCPYVGTAGCTLAGGLSWLSHELGLASDPANLLDAEIVTHDGRALWASEQPELLWALRGGGGNFGVVTTLRLRLHAYTTRIFAGLVLYPRSSLDALSRALTAFLRSPASHDPRLALHVFVLDFFAASSDADADAPGSSLNASPQLACLVYDAHGEEHGRSAAGFAWTFGVPGATSVPGVGPPREMPLRAVHALQASGASGHGTGHSWLQASLLSDEEVTAPGLLERAFDWYVMVGQRYPELAQGTFALVEVMQEAAFEGSGGRDKTAWPHGGKGERQHVLQLATGGKARGGYRGTLSNIIAAANGGWKSKEGEEQRVENGTEGAEGAKSEAADMEKKALEVLDLAPAFVTGNRARKNEGSVLPNFLLPMHDLRLVYAENWDRLREVKSRWDAKGKFGRGGGGYGFIPPLTPTA